MLIRWVEKGTKVLLGLLVGAMALVVLLQVIARYVLKIPLFWTEELGRYLMIWAGMVGAALAISYGFHASIEVVTNLFPQRLKAVLGVVMHLLMLTFAVSTIIASIRLMTFLRFQISPALRISMIYPYLAIPVGSAVMVLLLMPRLFRNFKQIWEAGAP